MGKHTNICLKELNTKPAYRWSAAKHREKEEEDDKGAPKMMGSRVCASPKGEQEQKLFASPCRGKNHSDQV